MKFSRSAKLAVVAALAATLGAKATFSRAAPAPDVHVFTARAAELLEARGFRTGLEHRPFGSIVHAEAGPCRLLLADYPPHGTIFEPLTSLAQPIGPLRFVWQGQVLEAAPKIMPLTFFFVQRELGRFGIATARRPLIAVAASPACRLEAIDWAPLAALPA